jgi:hydroxymethylbilane synthase
MTTLRIATRASELAVAQASLIARRIEAELRVATELLALKSTGDRLTEVSLARVGGKGLFVKEIEEAVLEGRADLAVHSAKDLPAVSPPELEFAAFPERADARDALVARERGARLETLAEGARVGTGSLRRRAQLRALRPDLEVVPLRGNVLTRLRKLEQEPLDAVILACAGLERLGLADRIDERLPPETMLPAVAQGALAVQGRRGDPISRDAAVLGHAETAANVAAERAVLLRLDADCTMPLAAHAQRAARGGIALRALLASGDGRRVARAERRGGTADPAALGRAAAEELLADGGEGILAALRAEAEA